jgi:hypothetical protein
VSYHSSVIRIKGEIEVQKSCAFQAAQKPLVYQVFALSFLCCALAIEIVSSPAVKNAGSSLTPLSLSLSELQLQVAGRASPVSADLHGLASFQREAADPSTTNLRGLFFSFYFLLP